MKKGAELRQMNCSIRFLETAYVTDFFGKIKAMQLACIWCWNQQRGSVFFPLEAERHRISPVRAIAGVDWLAGLDLERNTAVAPNAGKV